MWCIVNLPNGTQQAVKCDPKAIGQECLEKVCKALNIICEMEYFGLEHWQPNEKDSRTHQWINLRNRLSQDSGSGNSIQLMLALRVKFWVPVHLILQESVRNLFFMQAKVDLIEGRLNAKDWNNSAKLSALLCQADGIRFNEQSLTAKCPVHIKHEIIKDKKDKEPVLAFKKRRLSKQKSIESFDLPTSSSLLSSQIHQNIPTDIISSTSLSLSTSSSSSTSTSTSTSNSSSSSSNSSTSSTANHNNQMHNDTETSSPLQVYEDYIIRPNDPTSDMPDEFLRQIAKEHSKLSKIKMPQISAKYWLLKEIQDLPGFGEEVFSGVTANESSVRCDISVGAHGLVVCTGDEKNNIPFSAIAAAKSFRRIFKLEYLDDHSDRKELEIKLPKHAIAAGLYRSITERHAFYVCDKVRVVVTTQFTRDLKGTIASMFKEDTELGKRYVFDIQRTCREVHDQARRILYERGIEISGGCCRNDEIERYLPTVEMVNEKTVEDAIKLKEEREAAIERCVDSRITEAMTCKICMDKEINAMFNPCRHVTACSTCATKCDRCPICRAKVINVVKVFLPSELRTNAVTPNTNTTTTTTTTTNSADNTTGNKVNCTSNDNSLITTQPTITAAINSKNKNVTVKTKNNNNNAAGTSSTTTIQSHQHQHHPSLNVTTVVVTASTSSSSSVPVSSLSSSPIPPTSSVTSNIEVTV